MFRQYMLLDSQFSPKFKLVGKERNNTYLDLHDPPYVQPFLACGDQSSKGRENQLQIEV